ncbi:MAG: ATP-binding cassette domain-containing protein [Candidatus Aureabacteria bacterium]|nr:ATP-binding cassette domain-containing protein [Candidatus Auribacterota bacterium]
MPAVKDISFSLDRGEILGFLGPNGAGKTTTMRLLTGFLVPDRGEILIDGINIRKNPIKTKNMLGYLPEHVPLYGEMRVSEYLDFRSCVKIKNKKLSRERISEVCKICDIEPVFKRLIRNLSKGYRQRVGLADAILSDPPVLILDEPTTGLDPNQLRQTRNLIKNLRKRHAVLISTHILSEVEAICDRALIINEGRIAANVSLDKNEKVFLECENISDGTMKNIQNLSEVTDIRRVLENSLEIYTKNNVDSRRDIFEAVVKSGAEILCMKHTKDSLEDLFMEITSKQKTQ